MSWERPPVAEHLYQVLCESLSWFRSMKVKIHISAHARTRTWTETWTWPSFLTKGK